MLYLLILYVFFYVERFPDDYIHLFEAAVECLPVI